MTEITVCHARVPLTATAFRLPADTRYSFSLVAILNINYVEAA